MRILLVCLGNICRSPTAEAALLEAAAAAGLELSVDSAGTGDWHVGDPPDPRMTAAAAGTGLRLQGSARQVVADDFHRFEVILAMDASNLADLERLAPPDAPARIARFRDYDPDADAADVPDPYYGGPEGFDRVVDIARSGARGVVAAIQEGRL